jgi:CBS domain-containing protein
MLYSLAQILAKRPPLITIRHDAPMLDALRLLMERRLGQLPVVDETGCLRGVMSQQTLLGIYHMTGGKVPLLDLSVVDAMEPAHTLTLQDDLLTAVDNLRQRGVYAVIVVQEELPVGILTGKDMSVFFHSLFEGILLVERIERLFSAAVRTALPTDEAYTQALIAAFGADKNDPARPQRGQRGLSLTDMTYLARDDDNWPAFAPIFGHRDYFRVFMDRVRAIRNEIAHFDGQTDVLEMDALRRAAIWLDNRLGLATPPDATSVQPAAAVQTLARIISDRQPPVCTQPETPLREAMSVMIENRYGQLPVVDEHGCLLGMLSQQAILRTYYHTEGLVDLLDLPVHHCTEPAAILRPEDDLFKAANLLAQPGVYAPVVVEGDTPRAILTGKDMTHFFRSLFEGIILIERIETRLDEFTTAAFPEPAALNEAAKRAFGLGPKNPEYAARHPAHFTFGDRMLFMCDNDVWPAFEASLGSRELFMLLMDRVRRVRNALMHFRGNLSPSEQDALRKAHLWLSERPQPQPAPPWPPIEDYSTVRTTGNNPYPKVMGRKPRTLPAGAEGED